jgi:hypothetical protein
VETGVDGLDWIGRPTPSTGPTPPSIEGGVLKGSMRTPINLRFTHQDDDWRVMCHPASGRLDIWRNGSFLRSTIYVPGRGLRDSQGLVPTVVPALLDRLLPHDERIDDAQAIELV